MPIVKPRSSQECLAGSLGNTTSGPTAVTARGLEFCHGEFNGEELAETDRPFTSRWRAGTGGRLKAELQPPPPPAGMQRSALGCSAKPFWL